MSKIYLYACFIFIALPLLSYSSQYRMKIYCSECSLCTGITQCLYSDGGPFINYFSGCQLKSLCDSFFPINYRVYDCSCPTCCQDYSDSAGNKFQNVCVEQKDKDQICRFSGTSSLSIGLIIGIACGAVAAIAAIGIGIYCFKKRKTSRNGQESSPLIE